MAGRREQEALERRRQILIGALKVFSTRGFIQATNKDIAAEAGINSPGLIYHYFKDKADLLRAVVEEFAPPMQLVTHPEEMMALPPAAALTRFGLAYVRLMDSPDMGAFMKIIMGEALREPEFAQTMAEIGPLRVWRLLANYLQYQMEKGALRRTDPMLAARCFIGPLIIRLLMRNVFRLPDADDLTPEKLIAHNVEIFLHGMNADA
ncbi:MAG TPA: TetR/AcrR family transcriptional regulator [Chthonomonadaceae bacterium]|nr:TetR/AcrR family transcriptional regulator [Chthonomonadaceae bacterium]